MSEITPKIAVVVVVQNDRETIEASLASYYEHVDRICVVTDPHRGWSGAPITPDNTLDLVRALDKSKKIEIVEGDFYRFPEPMKNDTFQRQFAANHVSPGMGKNDWVLQIDADERFTDFPSFKAELARLAPSVKKVRAMWWTVWNVTEDGRLLVIANEDGTPKQDPFTVGHRPFARLFTCRETVLLQDRTTLKGKILNRAWGASDGVADINAPVIHNSYNKSEARIAEKLRTWGHAHDFDTDVFFELWKRSRRDWKSVRDFHPLTPDHWKRLVALSEADFARAVSDSGGGDASAPSAPRALAGAGR